MSSITRGGLRRSGKINLKGKIMRTQLIRLAVVLNIVGLMAVTISGLLPTLAQADSRPQEVLDLIAGHQALVVKIRPLHDRVQAPQQKKDSAGIKPDRAEKRAPETLRHKDRAVSSSDEYGRIKVQLSAFEKKARAERERVNNPRFGVGLAKRDSKIADARKTLATLQREFAALERQEKALGRR